MKHNNAINTDGGGALRRPAFTAGYGERQGYDYGAEFKQSREPVRYGSKEYTETFSGEHEKKPKDQEILHRFSQRDRGQKAGLGFRLWSQSNYKIPEKPWY